jgi:hypothetical protein
MFHGSVSALEVGADTVAAEKMSVCDRGLKAFRGCWLGSKRASRISTARQLILLERSVQRLASAELLMAVIVNA